MTQQVCSTSLEDYTSVILPSALGQGKSWLLQGRGSGHSCPGEGATQLLYAKQKSLIYSICLQILND